MFFHVFHSEWLKRKRSYASALVLGGSLFTPAIVIMVRLLKRKGLPALTGARVAAINRRLTARNLDVYEIRTVRNDLESIFLNLVRE